MTEYVYTQEQLGIAAVTLADISASLRDSLEDQVGDQLCFVLTRGQADDLLAQFHIALDAVLTQVRCLAPTQQVRDWTGAELGQTGWSR